MESPDFFVIKKVGNRTAADIYTLDPMLFQFCVTIVTLANFMQNSDHNKSVYEILPSNDKDGEQYFFV